MGRAWRWRETLLARKTHVAPRVPSAMVFEPSRLGTRVLAPGQTSGSEAGRGSLLVSERNTLNVTLQGLTRDIFHLHTPHTRTREKPTIANKILAPKRKCRSRRQSSARAVRLPKYLTRLRVHTSLSWRICYPLRRLLPPYSRTRADGVNN